MTANTIGVAGLGQEHSRLSARLASLTELTRMAAARSGSDGFSQDLLTDAEALLRRSGERMRMSGSHTVVALAGGTGSGKSSLFNALAGAAFSPAGVMRPTTKHSHACVWGMDGAAPLLDWLGVQRRHRYARASALSEGEASLTGLLLLDLPDHDSVVTGSAALVDRLVKMADMLVWVLDPLKYADASVHRRYLVPLAGHAAVTTVVLNQADTLPADQVADCAADLRRLLDAEGLLETPVLVTSAATGAGLQELRRTLAASVAERRAVSDRIAFDIDALLERFAVYAGDSVPGWLPPAEPALQLPAAPAAGRSGREAGPASPARPSWEQDRWGDEGLGAAAPAWPDVARTDPRRRLRSAAGRRPVKRIRRGKTPRRTAGRPSAGIDPLSVCPPGSGRDADRRLREGRRGGRRDRDAERRPRAAGRELHRLAARAAGRPPAPGRAGSGAQAAGWRSGRHGAGAASRYRQRDHRVRR